MHLLLLPLQSHWRRLGGLTLAQLLSPFAPGRLAHVPPQPEPWQGLLARATFAAGSYAWHAALTLRLTYHFSVWCIWLLRACQSLGFCWLPQIYVPFSVHLRLVALYDSWCDWFARTLALTQCAGL